MRRAVEELGEVLASGGRLSGRVSRGIVASGSDHPTGASTRALLTDLRELARRLNDHGRAVDDLAAVCLDDDEEEGDDVA